MRHATGEARTRARLGVVVLALASLALSLALAEGWLRLREPRLVPRLPAPEARGLGFTINDLERLPGLLAEALAGGPSALPGACWKGARPAFAIPAAEAR